MANVNFDVTNYGANRGSGAATLGGTEVIASGVDAITTVENLQDSIGPISLAAGSVFTIYSDENLRISFGGVAATATSGLFIPANTLRQFEVTAPGTVSALVVT